VQIMSESPPPAAPRRVLTLFDSTCIIVGIIIGSMFYETTPLIAQNTSSGMEFLGFWVLGGILSLVGALCYAELATRFPQQGGDYAYLTHAYGRPLGFLFAWSDLWILRPGSVGAMAYVFARYAYQLYSFAEPDVAFMVYAAGSVVALTGINLLGVQPGKWAQNLLVVFKVLGMALIAGAGLWGTPSTASPAPQAASWEGWGLALILILYAYGGWNELGYVGAEVRRPEKNLLRALILGTSAVMVLYVIAAGGFVRVLGMAGVQKSPGVAAEMMGQLFGDVGRRAISVLICVSCLGAINGQLFTGSRIVYALGRDHRAFRWLGSWNAERGTPVRGLIAIAAVVLILIALIGRTEHGFMSMVCFTTPVCWTFYFLAVLGLMLLRTREAGRPAESPYFHSPLYPLLPLVFCLMSLYLVYSGVIYAVKNHDPIMYAALAILAIGIVASWLGRSWKRSVD
jgi:basic amino acid/polyamine antiporter, APA family